MFVAGILLILVGLLSLFARDFLWAVTEFFNSLQGRASERSDIWEYGTIVAGVAFLILGLLLLLNG